jgi:exodeoxyribonuclease V gamma subunit
VIHEILYWNWDCVVEYQSLSAAIQKNNVGIEAMKSLRLFTGNRLELLARALARVLESPLASPLEPEIIVVQSKGMERWLSMQLALHFGVCANYRFPFPNAFAYETFQNVFPDLPDSSIFDPKFLTWSIMSVLPRHLGAPGFETLEHYLDGPGGSLKHLQLSMRIAETFDQYILYRPDMITRWEAGDEDHWQAVLWRRLARGLEKKHRGALGRIFMEKILGTEPGTLALPQRISIFGISYLPPFHIQIFEGLSRLTEVNMFLLNPCREYWGDISSERDIGRLASREGSAELAPEELFLDKGNPLLASMGSLAKDFFELLMAFDCEETDLFRDPGNRHLLTIVQSDILNLRDRSRQSNDNGLISEDDGSIQVHSCHSPMREVEVLYDHLLEMFERVTDLLPKDILVMAPDIETYTPFVQAVFDAPEDERRRVPYSIADRTMRKESQVADTFLALLNLWGERLTAPQVLGILESPPVHAKFGLTVSDLDVIVRWVRDVAIRWGADEQDRLQWSSNAFRENTWRGGLDRLLLGYAMPGQGEKLFGGILPYDHIEGSEAAVLGSLMEFVEQLLQGVASLKVPRTLDQWSEHLTNILSSFFLPSEDSKRELHSVRQVIGELGNIREVSGFSEPVHIRIIKWYLDKYLEREGFGHGFITGGVTFCSMLPMRSIPSRVICLMGMDVNSYPRQTKSPDFDLIARHPRPGDRSARNDDRYLFLESIISAREKLYISYTGQDCRDNSTIPPSVLVSELMDYLDRAFNLSHGDGPESLVIKHRLQPFSPAYFKGDRKLFTYSDGRLKEARCILNEKTRPPLLIPTVLSPPEEELRTVNIDQLCRFFANPARFLLDKRFGIVLEEKTSLLEETENFQLSGLEKYSLEQSLVESSLAGREPTDLFPSMKASGKLPHGTPGESAFRSMNRGVEAFARELGPYLLREQLEPLDIDLHFSGFAITGRIQSIFPERMVRYRYANLKAKDHLSLWIHHLVLNAVRKPGYPRKSIIAGLNFGKWYVLEYAPVEDSMEILDQLIEGYWNGLIKPLHFFPETSFKYAQLVLQKGKPPQEALARAESNWSGSDYNRGESEEPHFDLCFRYGNPIDAEFQRISEEIFGPLLTCQKEVSDSE